MRWVTYSVGEGLCNRLRIHLIAHAYAIHAKAPLIVRWPVVQAFGARYDDVFVRPPDLMRGEALFGSLILRVFRHRKIRFNGPRAPGFSNVGELPVPRYGLVDFGEVFSPFAYENDGQVLGAYRRRVIESLQPVPEVGAVLAGLKGRLQGPVVGVHIRRGDFHVSFPDLLLPIGFYRQVMADIVGQLPGVRFFISSDDHEFAAPLIDEFQAVIHVKAPRTAARDAWSVFQYANRCNRDTVQGAREAVTDLFMLKGCAAILGAPGSSFTAMAGLLGGARPVLPTADTRDETTRCANEILDSLRVRPAVLSER